MIAAVVREPAAGLGRGVVVLGMHRSGTSAVTAVIDALGVPACIAPDRMAHDLYESRTLTRFDERLLNLLGGSWIALPESPPGWATSPSVLALRGEAAELFRAVHPFRQWVWKDPRACVLMPFWEQLIGRDVPRIIVLRNPVECAESLWVRNQIPHEISLAMFERSVRSALRDSAGCPVFLAAYDDVLADPGAWCAEVASFLDSRGLVLPKPLPLAAAAARVKLDLRHHAAVPGTMSPGGPGEHLRPLWTWALGRSGAHTALSTDNLPPESPATGRAMAAAAQNRIPADGWP